MEHEKITAPGLKFRTRADGRMVPVWCARADAIKAGWPIKTANLSETPPHLIRQRCERLQIEMLEFLGKKSSAGEYDGTIGSVLNLYMDHPRSPYHRLKPSSRRPYDVYLGRLRAMVGKRLIADVTGLDIIAWHDTWSNDGTRLAAAAMARAVLKSALNWAVLCDNKKRKADCLDLRATLGSKDLGLASPQSRTHAPTAAEIEKARTAAHQLGHPPAAFAYALQFEAASRQWDIVGQWVPLSDPQPSAVIYRREKWIGPAWASIDANLILTLTPGKTNRTTKKRTHIDLKLCPMVMEELALIPPESRCGPLIVNPKTGRPYLRYETQGLWAKVREIAGLPKTMWNRDIRAGAITEGGAAGVSSDDRGKLAGHADGRMTREVYDRDVLEGSNRAAVARARFRKGDK